MENCAIEKNENEHQYGMSHSLIEANLNDEDESSNAPVEILAEFLSSFMSRDYKSALHYCKLILQYEPENETVQDFYPLIEKKIHNDSGESDDSFDECNSDSCAISWSENSTEYFSSDFAENSPLSSKEDLSVKSLQ